ncbi:Membrane protein involved in the export of O-antigen, teichoic acid lipoteichoic acid [Enterococcus cecorum]|uniref:oligosaccharide flippase family protein n=1 Tax=Enterococcus cecorum TaxID=44008 RepID=UPI000E01DF7F|nr:oligosaccharide flippase family protein [Enterococcus cecorum]CAI3428376.1 hypothetical protein CIRMBP1220_01771 [Enterococcus cecorum]STP86559.1 Membrane protein involved in the export of O-antigen, teichoic acid lipoteichoic acid [Enterococcus cecorum]
MKKNFIYNLIYNVLVLIVPLITIPYCSRVLGATKIGMYTYTYTIASYFSLFIMMGLSNYGNRSIAVCRNNIIERSKTFVEIYTMQLFFSIVIITSYCIYTIFFSPYKDLAWIQLIYLISVSIDITWFYFGIEKFKLTVTRSLFIKFLNLVLIMLFVKNSEDIWKYTLIMSLSAFFNQILLWRTISQNVVYVRIRLKDILVHIKPNVILFFPVIAVSIYMMFDKLMLGKLTNMRELGLFENSYKLIQIPSVLVTALGTAMLPRISNLVKENDREVISSYLRKSLIYGMTLTSAMVFGISAVVNEFVPLYFGKGFEKCTVLIPLLLISSLFMSYANIIRTQILIPFNYDSVFVYSSIFGAVVNIVANLILIPRLYSIGAALGTILAEMVVCFYQIYKVKEYNNIIENIKETFPFIFISILMYTILSIIPPISDNVLNRMLFKILLGLIVYFILLVMYTKYKYKLNIYKLLIMYQNDKGKK